tara:strand:- start:574 stop:891 length:318 start_codon:yes stop_codon:yes gene_type:complete
MPVAPKNVRDIAKRVLAVRKTLPPSRQAGTPVGLARANQLANGDNLSVSTLVRMRSYLLRSRENYRKAKKAGLTRENSKAIQAYELWGSTPALNWVNSELRKVGR